MTDDPITIKELNYGGDLDKLIEKWSWDCPWTSYVINESKIAYRLNNKTGERQELEYDKVSIFEKSSEEWRK